MPASLPVRGSLVLDFDSTLVPCESLEELLDSGDATLRERIADITRAGMEGRLAFRESLEQRLALARPERGRTERLGRDLARRVGDDVIASVAALAARGVEPWIVSGAFRELLLPTAARLGVPPARVCGVRPVWGAGGAFLGLADDDPFATSKVLGVRALREGFARPAIGVGDGATDRALFEAGLVDRFVAFTGHVRRVNVVTPLAPGAVAEARDFAAVRRVVETWLP